MASIRLEFERLKLEGWYEERKFVGGRVKRSEKVKSEIRFSFVQLALVDQRKKRNYNYCSPQNFRGSRG